MSQTESAVTTTESFVIPFGSNPHCVSKKLLKMPIYYALSLGGERKGDGKIRKTKEGGAKEDVNKMEVDELREWVWKQRKRHLGHVDAEDLEVYYLPSREAFKSFTGDVSRLTKVEFDETVDTSSPDTTIYLGVTAPPPPGTVACAVPTFVCLSK